MKMTNQRFSIEHSPSTPTYRSGELDVRDNQYAIQVHSDLINGLLGAIGLKSGEVHLLPGTEPRNSRVFFTELNEEQVNAVVSQFGCKPRFQIQAVEWYRGANLTNMSAVYEVWIKNTHKDTWSPMLYAFVLACSGQSLASCSRSHR